MKLKEYLKEEGLSYVAFGRKCMYGASRIGEVALSNKCSQNMALQIINATGGKVTMDDFEISPDAPSKAKNWNRKK